MARIAYSRHEEPNTHFMFDLRVIFLVLLLHIAAIWPHPAWARLW